MFACVHVHVHPRQRQRREIGKQPCLRTRLPCRCFRVVCTLYTTITRTRRPRRPHHTAHAAAHAAAIVQPQTTAIPPGGARPGRHRNKGLRVSTISHVRALDAVLVEIRPPSSRHGHAAHLTTNVPCSSLYRPNCSYPSFPTFKCRPTIVHRLICFPTDRTLRPHQRVANPRTNPTPTPFKPAPPLGSFRNLYLDHLDHSRTRNISTTTRINHFLLLFLLPQLSHVLLPRTRALFIN